MTFSADLQVAVSTTIDLTVIAAGCVPVPGLAGVAHIVAGILKLCNDVRVNKAAVDGLVSAQKLLEGIEGRVRVWANKPYYKLILKRTEISEGVKHFHEEINNFLERFNVAAHLKIQRCFVIQEYMGNFAVDDERHVGLKKNLYTMQEYSGQLLPRIELKSGEVRRVGRNAIRGNAAFEIWEGDVAVTPIIRDQFLKEVEITRKVWEDDRGEYILPFWGACFDDGQYPYMVSPWMDYDAREYIIKFTYVNRKKFLRRVAEGIGRLHSYNPPIVHGAIRGANILINQKGDLLLADFGLSKVMENVTGVQITHTSGISESYRWSAPELCSDPYILTTASDVFAFAMTVIELMTGEAPYSHIKRNSEVLIKMGGGERPLRPEGTEIIERGLDDKLWNLLIRCWAADLAERPTIHEVITELPAE
ncbi:hypothetical protein ACEPAG_2875 [Sanghuangporus baumii]